MGGSLLEGGVYCIVKEGQVFLLPEKLEAANVQRESKVFLFRRGIKKFMHPKMETSFFPSSYINSIN